MTRRRPRSRILPKYVKWRDGRPRWELGGQGGRTLVEAGFRSIDLKDLHGNWLSFEQAKIAGEALNQAVADWREGKPAPDNETLETIAAAVPAAPAAVLGEARAVHGAPSTGHFMQAPASRANRTLSHYISAHLDSLKGGSKATLATYRSKAKPLAVWLGDIRPADVTPEWAQKYHASLLDTAFWKEEEIEAGRKPPRVAHETVAGFSLARKEELRARRLDALGDLDDMRDAPGFTMAYDACIYARAMWSWARRNEGLAAPNPFEDMGLMSPLGRVRYLVPAEINCLIETADSNGMEWAGDIVITALHTLQRRADQMRLTWPELHRGAFELVQSKTGRKGKIVRKVSPAVTAGLRARAEGMARRQAKLLGMTDPNPVMMGELLRDASGQPFTDPRQLTTAFEQLRTLAAKRMPSLADSRLHDLKDTGITRFYLATKDLVRVCKQSGNSPSSIEMIIKAYLADHPEIAQSAADSHDDWLAQQGAKW